MQGEQQLEEDWKFSVRTLETVPPELQQLQQFCSASSQAEARRASIRNCALKNLAAIRGIEKRTTFRHFGNLQRIFVLYHMKDRMDGFRMSEKSFRSWDEFLSRLARWPPQQAYNVFDSAWARNDESADRRRPPPPER